MAAMKRIGAQSPAAARASAGRNAAAAISQRDLAEAGRRARAAKTPAAKVATQQVLEAKQRAYSGHPSRQVSRRDKGAAKPVAAPVRRTVKASPQRRGTRRG